MLGRCNIDASADIAGLAISSGAVPFPLRTEEQGPLFVRPNLIATRHDAAVYRQDRPGNPGAVIRCEEEYGICHISWLANPP